MTVANIEQLRAAMLGTAEALAARHRGHSGATYHQAAVKAAAEAAVPGSDLAEALAVVTGAADPQQSIDLDTTGTVYAVLDRAVSAIAELLDENRDAAHGALDQAGWVLSRLPSVSPHAYALAGVLSEIRDAIQPEVASS